MLFTKADAEKIIKPNLQIKEIVIPEGFTEIEEDCDFKEATELEKVVLPESMTKIGSYAFKDCEKLSQINFPKNLKEIEYGAFSNTGFTELDLPETLEDISSAFKSCKNLTKVTLSNFKFGSAFENCENLTEIKFNEGITEIYYSAFSDCKNLKEIKLPSTVKKIGSAFKNCENLLNVELNEGLEEIGGGAFSKTKISKIKLPSSLKIISGFKNSALSEIELPSNLEKIGSSAFENCENLTKISIPENCYIIEYEAFHNCKNLKEVILPKEIKYRNNYGSLLGGIKNEAFSYCESLEKIELPSNLESISSSAFIGCKNLKEINFPESLKKIDSEAFSSCGFSGKMNTKDIVISRDAFNYCPITELECNFSDYDYDENLKIESLEKLTINNEIELQDGNFFASNNIKELIFNKKLSVIQEGVFSWFKSLEKIEFNGGLENYAFESNCIYELKKKRLIRAFPVEKKDGKEKYIIPEVIKEFGIRSFPLSVENENVEIEIKGTIKKVFDEAVDGYSKEKERDWRNELRKPSKAVGGAKIIYAADDLKKAKDSKNDEIKAAGNDGLINAGFEDWNLGFSKEEKSSPKRITYTVNLPFNASFEFNVNTKTTKAEVNMILDTMNVLKEIQDDEIALFDKVQELDENCKDGIKSGYNLLKKIRFANCGVINVDFAKKIIESYFKDSDVEYSLKITETTEEEDNPEVLIEIKKGNKIVVMDKFNLTSEGNSELKNVIQIAKESSETDFIQNLNEKIRYSDFEIIDLEKLHD